MIVAKPKAFIQWAFAAFVFSIPFEAVDIGSQNSFSLSRIVGYGFFLLAALQPTVSFRRPAKPFWWFLFYVLIQVLWIPFQPAAFRMNVVARLFTLAQMLVFYWIATNLLRYDQVVRTTLAALAAACVIVAVLQTTGAIERYREGAGTREAAFGQDPNSAGSVLGLGMIAVVGFFYGRSRKASWTSIVVWMVVPSLAIALVRTGSRGALVATALGLSVFILREGTAWVRFRNLVIVCVTLAALLWISLTSETAMKRWERTVEQGSLAGREQIYPAAFRLFLDRPLTGWGPVMNTRELGRRLGHEFLDTHNIYLWLLTEVGLVGAIPYFIGLGLSVRAAWTSRRQSQSVLPLALLTALLLINMSISWGARKLHWLILAFAVASAAQVVSRKRRRVRSARRLGLSASLPRGRTVDLTRAGS